MLLLRLVFLSVQNLPTHFPSSQHPMHFANTQICRRAIILLVFPCHSKNVELPQLSRKACLEANWKECFTVQNGGRPHFSQLLKLNKF